MPFYYELKISTDNLNSLVLIRSLLKDSAIKSEISLPKKSKRFVVLKSPHVNKKSKEHFQILKYTRIFFVCFSQSNLCDFFRKAPNDFSARVRKLEKQTV